MTTAWKIVYYISTGILFIGMGLSGYFDFIQAPEEVVILTHLGYPAYLATIIGAAKILGVIGIWQNKVPFLREWAYAGFVFDTLGALLSHLFVRDTPAQAAPAAVSLAIVLISYAAWRRRQRV